MQGRGGAGSTGRSDHPCVRIFVLGAADCQIPNGAGPFGHRPPRPCAMARTDRPLPDECSAARRVGRKFPVSTRWTLYRRTRCRRWRSAEFVLGLPSSHAPGPVCLSNGLGWQGMASPLCLCRNARLPGFFPWAFRPFLASQETRPPRVLHMRSGRSGAAVQAPALNQPSRPRRARVRTT